MATTVLLGLPALTTSAFAQQGESNDTRTGSYPARAEDGGASKSTGTKKRTEPTKASEDEGSADAIVVTGTLLKDRSNDSSTSPIQVITAQDMVLRGEDDLANALQDSTAAANAPQVDGNWAGRQAEGGPGVRTVSLRGLGALRTLILVNGHRVGPSGVQGQVGPVDLNTIPNGIVERVEILKDGASSLYGSDAVAGVINIITKNRFNGGSANVVASMPLQGGGSRQNINVTQGFTAGRFHASIGLDYSNQEALNWGDRDWSRCQQSYVFFDDGTRADLIDPQTGTYKCNPYTIGSISTGGALYLPDPTATLNGGITGLDRVGLHRVRFTFPTSNPNYVALTRQSRGENRTDDPRFANINIFSPSSRYSVVATGGYDLGTNSEIYFDVLATQRNSSDFTYGTLFPTVDRTNPNNIAKAGNTLGLAVNSASSNIPYPIITKQKIKYLRGMLGVRGEMPDSGLMAGWKWDVAAQFSHSSGIYGRNFVYADRVLATTAAGTVCNTALLTSATDCPVGGVQWFRTSTVTNLEYTPEETAFLFGYEEGKTTYDQKYVEAIFTGDLLNLPAGTVGAAFGLQFRKESMNDQPGPQAVAKNYHSFATVGATKGDDTVKEVFGEISIPLIKDFVLAKSFDVDVSSRFSDYDSYGSSATYKVGINWAVNDALRFRASQGTSFRAPGLYERFLAPQTFNWQQTIDPCFLLLRGQLNSPTTNMVNNCANVLPVGYSGGQSAVAPTGGNGATLKAETSLNKSAGMIFTPGFLPLTVTVDYYDTSVRNQIAGFGPANIFRECYNSLNLSSPFCSLFTRATTAGSGYVPGNITFVDNSYQNISEQRQKGIDISASIEFKLFGGQFVFSSDNTFIRKWTYQLFSNTDPLDNLGRIGYPKYTGKLNFQYQKNDWTFNWGVDLVAATSNLADIGTDLTTNFQGTGVTVRNVVDTPFYHSHSFAVSKKMGSMTATLAMRNVFDRDPPIISAAAGGRVGNAAFTSQYDQMGRTLVLNLKKTW